MVHDPKQITETAFLLTPAFQELVREKNLDAETIARVSKRIEQLRAGLAPELEFICVVNWLGNCLALHRLDQLPMPKYRADQSMRVPDVLAIPVMNGKRVPVLIEVKKCEDDKIVWREDYLQELLAYADALSMPLLVAWKRLHIWSLTDVRHFEKRVTAFHLPWEKALKENLMAKLFGDLMIVLTDQIAFFMDADITSDEPVPPLPSLLVGTYTFTITAAGFLLNEQPIKVRDELKRFVMLQANENRVERTSERSIRNTYRPDEDSMSSLSDYGLTMLLWNEEERDKADWETIARNKIEPPAATMRDALRAGLKDGVVRYVLEQSPHTVPDFLR
jgi:Holliday junction resolvase